jgi:DNA polymerase elongation subunit (family B)
MSYVDAFLEREKDRINVVERIDGKRHYKTYPTRYTFYYADPAGKYKSIYNLPLSRFSTKSRNEFDKEKKSFSHQKLYESDINPIFRCLEENYLESKSPELHICFFDIEVDFDPDKGFAPPGDPFNKITAITMHLNWLPEERQLITLCLAPKGLSHEDADVIAGKFSNTIVCKDEKELLDLFLKFIEDADILSGWNSEGFDIPYTVNRTIQVLGKSETSRYCLWDKFPRKRQYVKFGSEQETYDLIGRVHLDYLELYRKYTYHEMHSYRLDAIGDYEIGEKKVPYEGTLDSLYNNDFEKFIAYNRQDTALLAKLDDKLKFIDLANELAHANTVLLPTTQGAVAVTEQAIINEAHQRGMIIPDRKRQIPGQENTPAVGAYVAFPKKGLHSWIGSFDINSLYPSVIRSLNMGPDAIIGQLRLTQTESYIDTKMNKEKKSAADAWEGLFGTLEYTAVMNKDVATEVVCDFEDGTTESMSGAEWHKVIFEMDNPWCLSANGTLFRTDIKAIIPGLLERWYAERKQMQAKMREEIEAGNTKNIAFWDKRQLVKKINLNSLYGAILNPGCRFFDTRIGQSVTLSGRTITKHMACQTNNIIAGEYDHQGQSIIYGDTDSVYFSAYPLVKDDVKQNKIEWTKESVVELYDSIADEVNKSFPEFMNKSFSVSKEQGEIIKSGREIVASSGLFITKKRYAALIYDLEGKRQDVDGKPGKIKAMGVDLKRSDTPEFVQRFLEKLLTMVLLGTPDRQCFDMINEFKEEFGSRPGWEKGTPKRVNNLTKYRNVIKAYNNRTDQLQYVGQNTEVIKKPIMPGHVRASINWNELRSAYKDKYSLPIMDGQKVIVCKLKQNPMNYTSIAYPIDELNLPEWFKELPFDHSLMETTIIDQKIKNLIGVLGWKLQEETQTNNVFDNLFATG